MKYSRGLSPEQFEEEVNLRKDRENYIINSNPELKSIAEEYDVKRKRYGELLRERQEREENELVEIEKLRLQQEEVKRIKEYDAFETEINSLKERIDNRKNEIKQLQNEVSVLDYKYNSLFNDVARNLEGGIPDAPFDKNWHELAMKRMLRYAAENGYDKMAWTTGEQQAERYDMSRDVENIKSTDNTIEEASDGTPIAKDITIRTVSGTDINMSVDANGMVRGGEYNGKQITDVLGKELGEKAMQKGDHTLTTPDLKIGGEGMKGFYDKILPTFMNKYGKKWGVKVGETELPSLGEDGLTMHSIDVTPEMRESVMQGQVMFRLSDSRLRKLEDGEVCNVERIFTENKNFDFTSNAYQ